MYILALCKKASQGLGRRQWKQSTTQCLRMCPCSGNRMFDEYNFLFIIYNLTMIRMNYTMYTAMVAK